MTTTIKYCALFSILFISTSSVAHEETINTTIESGKWIEKCIKSKHGKVIRYSFTALRPVNFNIHWHKRKKITYSVKHDNIKKLSGSFEPSVKETFCLSWLDPKDDKKKTKFSYSYSNTDLKH